MRQRRNQKGFTLVEILIAMSLLTVGLLAVASLTAGIIQRNNHGKMATSATTLAQDKLENARRLGYGNVPAGTEDYSSITDYPFFKRITGVAVDDPAPGMDTVTVTVYWNNDVSSIEMKTILSP